MQDSDIYLVRRDGLEPPELFQHRIYSPARYQLRFTDAYPFFFFTFRLALQWRSLHMVGEPGFEPGKFTGLKPAAYAVLPLPPTIKSHHNLWCGYPESNRENTSGLSRQHIPLLLYPHGAGGGNRTHRLHGILPRSICRFCYTGRFFIGAPYGS